MKKIKKLSYVLLSMTLISWLTLVISMLMGFGVNLLVLFLTLCLMMLSYVMIVAIGLYGYTTYRKQLSHREFRQFVKQGRGIRYALFVSIILRMIHLVYQEGFLWTHLVLAILGLLLAYSISFYLYIPYQKNSLS
ncbi:hypothetical protein [Streptococcus sp. zg-JUN1979]|uniref:hypothetical protein n=1 Tax=Streptococcus sp. zg-JUN1979 TaxID=3391450 RepID=UPI0039A5F354